MLNQRTLTQRPPISQGYILLGLVFILMGVAFLYPRLVLTREEFLADGIRNFIKVVLTMVPIGMGIGLIKLVRLRGRKAQRRID